MSIDLNKYQPMYKFGVEFSASWVKSITGSDELPMDVIAMLEMHVEGMRQILKKFEENAKTINETKDEIPRLPLP